MRGEGTFVLGKLVNKGFSGQMRICCKIFLWMHGLLD